MNTNANESREKLEPWEAETWQITVKAAGVGAPTCVRVRRALKHLLRTHGLRCTSAIELKPTPAVIQRAEAQGEAGEVP